MSPSGRGCVETRDLCGGFRDSGASATYFDSVLKNWRRIFATKTDFYPVIAFIRDFAPKICIVLFRLYANTCKLISVLTRGSVLVRK